MKPICVPCQRFYRPKTNGFTFIEQMPVDNNALPGTAEPERWKPYKLWMSDLWRCEGCGHETIVGVANRPIGEHYQPDFAELCTAWGATLKVNDC